MAKKHSAKCYISIAKHQDHKYPTTSVITELYFLSEKDVDTFKSTYKPS